MCGYVHMRCKCLWEPEEGDISFRAGVQAAVSCLMWLLGTKLRMSA